MKKIVVGEAVVCAAAVCTMTDLVIRHQMNNCGKSSQAMNILKVFEEKCNTPIEKLKQVADPGGLDLEIKQRTG